MREFDIVVYGATGYTGRLIAEYLGARDHGVRWAMAGRSLSKLESVRDTLGLDVPLITADADDPATLLAMCNRTRVVLSAVGPYQLHGSALVAACVASGTGYADLCGEPAWMRHMIDAHATEARATGARIVFSCGFDSIPFDLGVWTLQEAARTRFGRPFPRVKGRVVTLRGTFSGGTFASASATMSAAAKDPSIFKLMIDPFALTPGFEGPHQPTGLVPEYDDVLRAWAGPFVMAAINTKNVHRTNALTDHAYGADFVYDEMMIAPGLGDFGKAAVGAMAKLNPLSGSRTPSPGEGPSAEERESGHYEIAFLGEMPDGTRLKATVTGDRDPGYGSTSKMVAEAAICLVKDVGGDGGIWTPGALMAAPLIERLTTNAGLTFRIDG